MRKRGPPESLFNLTTWQTHPIPLVLMQWVRCCSITPYLDLGIDTRPWKTLADGRTLCQRHWLSGYLDKRKPERITTMLSRISQSVVKLLKNEDGPTAV